MSGNGYTKADNWLWDYVMPRAAPNTFKVVSAVVRMTMGWHVDEVEMTYDDFTTITGIGGRSTLSRAIDDALEKEFIQRRQDGRACIYSPNIVPFDGPKMVLKDGRTVPKQDYEQSQNGTENSPKMGPSTSSTYKERKERERKEPPKPPEPDIEHEIPGMPPDLRPPNDVDFPDSLRDPDFLELWWQYERHRDQLGRPLSTVSRQRALNRAAREGIEATSWLINQTLENGWQGIIWERLAEKNGARASPNGKKSAIRSEGALRDYAEKQGWSFGDEG